ncbi:hypothetical protein D7243_22970 [Stutzerimonas stutzeri]|nr:hypothetical protein [Stutzerimonas stutzeri]
MSKVLVDRELPEPYGWIAVGELYMIRENAIRVAGKTSCIGVYTRPQLLAALSAVTAERDRLRDAAGKAIAWLDAEQNESGVGINRRIKLCRDAENSLRAAMAAKEA